MERALFYLRLFPGTEPEYDQRHQAVWPDLADEIRESGLRNMSGFRRGTDVWYYVEAEPDARTAFALLGPKSANQRWGHYFRDVIAEIATPEGELLWYDEVFHAGGEPLPGPMSRGLLSLVILAIYLWLAPSFISDGDNAEFSTLSVTGGVAHPPGYPLYVLYLRAMSWLPGSSGAHTAALATAILGALAA